MVVARTQKRRLLQQPRHADGVKLKLLEVYLATVNATQLPGDDVSSLIDSSSHLLQRAPQLKQALSSPSLSCVSHAIA